MRGVDVELLRLLAGGQSYNRSPVQNGDKAPGNSSIDVGTHRLFHTQRV